MDTDDHPRDLGDGLVLRRTGTADIERFVELALHVFRDNEAEEPHLHLAAWTRDLGSGRHPLSDVQQGIVVEDTRSGRLVAGLWQIPAIWTYAGIPFGIVRPEMVASRPEYRRRGLVRALFEAFHARSAADGHLAQAIKGIPYYYRQFGYEYAVDLFGYRTVMFDDIPRLPVGEIEPYTLREVRADDLPFVMALYERERERSLVSATIPPDYWGWELDGANPASLKVWRMFLLVDRAGTRCGCVLAWPFSVQDGIGMHTVAVAEGVALHTVIRPILRALRELAPTFKDDDQTVNRIFFDLGATHPVYDVLGTALAPRLEPPEAWYVRVPDLPAFIRHIAPALEQRLASSAIAGYNGQLQLDFYRSLLLLTFENGRLTAAKQTQPSLWGGESMAGFPPNVFLQLLFGRRSLSDLRYAFPDVWASAEGQLLLNVLFPPQHSHVLPLD